MVVAGSASPRRCSRRSWGQDHTCLRKESKRRKKIRGTQQDVRFIYCLWDPLMMCLWGGFTLNRFEKQTEFLSTEVWYLLLNCCLTRCRPSCRSPLHWSPPGSSSRGCRSQTWCLFRTDRWSAAAGSPRSPPASRCPPSHEGCWLLNKAETSLMCFLCSLT